MATKEQIEQALKSDDADKHRQSMTHEERMARFVDNGLPKFVAPIDKEHDEMLAKILAPSS